MKNKIIMLLAVLLPTAAPAQTHLFGLGPSRILDTYLSQEKFSGTGFTYLYMREHDNPGKHWNNIIEHEADISTAEDRNKKISEMEGNYNLYWGRYRQWTLLDRETSKPGVKQRLRLQAGGVANANIGFIYMMLNTNNPAQLRAGVNIMPSGIATYDFPLFRQQFTARYEVNLPLVGVMFSPNYGQSYYEIFSRGEYDNNIVPTTFVSAPTLRQMLTLEWHTGKKWNIRIGYLGNYQQAAVNNLKQHIYTSRFLIGIVRSLEVKSEK